MISPTVHVTVHHEHFLLMRNLKMKRRVDMKYNSVCTVQEIGSIYFIYLCRLVSFESQTDFEQYTFRSL